MNRNTSVHDASACLDYNAQLSRLVTDLSSSRTMFPRTQSIGGNPDLLSRLLLSRTREKPELEEHFNDTPLWRFATASQPQFSILLPVHSVLLFSLFGLGLCYQATA